MTSSHSSVMKDARRSGLGGSSSKVVGLKRTFVCVKHVREKHKARTCAEARVSVVLVSSHPENPEKHQNLPTFFSDNDCRF